MKQSIEEATLGMFSIITGMLAAFWIVGILAAIKASAYFLAAVVAVVIPVAWLVLAVFMINSSLK